MKNILKLIENDKLEEAIDKMNSSDLWLDLNFNNNNVKFKLKPKTETDAERERIKKEALKRVKNAIDFENYPLVA